MDNGEAWVRHLDRGIGSQGHGAVREGWKLPVLVYFQGGVGWVLPPAGFVLSAYLKSPSFSVEHGFLLVNPMLVRWVRQIPPFASVPVQIRWLGFVLFLIVMSNHCRLCIVWTKKGMLTGGGGGLEEHMKHWMSTVIWEGQRLGQLGTSEAVEIYLLSKEPCH